MKVYYLIILIFSTEISFGQITGIIKDSVSNEPIPYVNIWLANENIGTTSNEYGEFIINSNGTGKTIIFSSIGYETKKINSESINKDVRLNPKITELKEVVVVANKHRDEIVIGGFKKSGINLFYVGDKTPWIVARYYGFKEDYSQTPFLKKIRILTNCDVKDSKFNIRLYSVNENGTPGDYIYDKNIICISRKGKKITEVDISSLNIKFPETGFFIGIEWLIIESNKYEFIYTMNGSKEKLKGIRYNPSIGAIPSETDENSWIYSQGTWRKVGKNTGPVGPLKQYKDKFNLFAIELTLTN